MAMPSRVAAVAAAVALAVTPSAALAAKAHHRSARTTCAALKKKEGTKRFDARYGKGSSHANAMSRCIRAHSAKKSSTRAH
jgi:hypothetical protein